MSEPNPGPAGPVVPPQQEGRRRYPSTLGGLAYIVVGLVTAAGLAVVAFGPWRRGIAVIGVALVLAAGARLVIAENDAGMLRVRSRWFDVGFLTVVGVALVVLAANIPDQL